MLGEVTLIGPLNGLQGKLSKMLILNTQANLVLKFALLSTVLRLDIQVNSIDISLTLADTQDEQLLATNLTGFLEG